MKHQTIQITLFSNSSQQQSSKCFLFVYPLSILSVPIKIFSPISTNVLNSQIWKLLNFPHKQTKTIFLKQINHQQSNTIGIENKKIFLILCYFFCLMKYIYNVQHQEVKNTSKIYCQFNFVQISNKYLIVEFLRGSFCQIFYKQKSSQKYYYAAYGKQREYQMLVRFLKIEYQNIIDNHLYYKSSVPFFKRNSQSSYQKFLYDDDEKGAVQSIENNYVFVFYFVYDDNTNPLFLFPFLLYRSKLKHFLSISKIIFLNYQNLNKLSFELILESTELLMKKNKLMESIFQQQTSVKNQQIFTNANTINRRILSLQIKLDKRNQNNLIYFSYRVFSKYFLKQKIVYYLSQRLMFSKCLQNYKKLLIQALVIQNIIVFYRFFVKLDIEFQLTIQLIAMIQQSIKNHCSRILNINIMVLVLNLQFFLKIYKKRMFKEKIQQDFSQELSNLSQDEGSSVSKQQESLEKVGKWSFQQNVKYVVFLDFYKAQLSSKKKRRDFKMFNVISRFIITRTPLQCRSHHQKLQKKYKSLKSLINAQKEEIGLNHYRELYRELKPQLTSFNFHEKKQTIETNTIAIQTDITWIEQRIPPPMPCQQEVFQQQYFWPYSQIMYTPGCCNFF